MVQPGLILLKAEYQTRLDHLVQKIQSADPAFLLDATHRMGKVAAALSPEVFPEVMAVYNDAQRIMFDAGHINHFAHTTISALGFQEVGDSVDLFGAADDTAEDLDDHSEDIPRAQY